jgi:hypothetical protein
MAESRGGPRGMFKDVELEKMYGMARTRGTPPLTQRALMLAMKNDAKGLEDKLGLATDLQGKIADDPLKAYLHTWGERNARVSEEYAGKSLDWMQKNPPSTVDRARVPMNKTFDIREFSPKVWRELGLL